MRRKIWIPLLLIIVLIAICFIAVAGRDSYKSALNNYFSAYEHQSGHEMYNVIPEYWSLHMIKGEYYSSQKSLESKFQDDIMDELESWGCGSHVKITYSIKNKVRATKSELKELEDDLWERYAYYIYSSSERSKFKITDAYRVELSFTVKGGTGIINRVSTEPGWLLVKENGKWRYHRYGSVDCSFYH